MRASDFQPPPLPKYSPLRRFMWSIPLYGIGVPLVKSLEFSGALQSRRFERLRQRMRQRMEASFANYQPTRHDVIACVGFKSGTTWLLQIAVQIAFRGEAEFDKILSVVAWPDTQDTFFGKYVIPLADESSIRRSPTGLRIIKTHLVQSAVPYSSEARYIAMVRDPKDVLVSAYHFARSMAYGPMMPTVGYWVESFLSGKLPWGSWAEHLAGYWRLRHEPNVLFLTYEQLSADLPGGIRKIAQFMSVELSPVQFEAVLGASTFEAMKRLRDKFDTGKLLPWSQEHSMLRSGKSGGSAELLSAEQRQRIDDHCRAELRRLNCDFPYDAAFAAALRH